VLCLALHSKNSNASCDAPEFGAGSSLPLVDCQLSMAVWLALQNLLLTTTLDDDGRGGSENQLGRLILNFRTMLALRDIVINFL
jgi:hypothetical protein